MYRTNDYSLNMEDKDDLQVDCAAHDPPSGYSAIANIRPELKRFIHPSMKTDGQREDSGIYSFEQSLKSTDDISDNDMVDRSLLEDITKMQISEPEVKSENKQCLETPPEDDGYHSKSITDFHTTWGEEFGRSVEEIRGHVYCLPGVSHEAREAYMQDDDGDTQLHMAIIQLAESIALQLINLAPNHEWLNFVNTLLQTPLHLAVITRQEKIVRRLMAAGASVDVRDLHGNTPLHIAAREGYHEIVNHLLKPVCYEETQDNKYEIPYQRVPQDLEAKNYDGHTCLHLSALGTHTKVMESLIKKAAKVNAQDGKSGRTVLHYAAETGNRILLEFLLGCKRLNLDSCTYGGLTPIVLAAGRKFGDVVGILQAHGADCTSLQEDTEDEDEDMIDDFCIAGEPLSLR
ncbi:NF-kappa-B inhibitor alpha-like [Haliotis rubra]|uniref:NF-kappa-B inhibitor alpha-like n=1 Tax=Haliotis rubra TaxID=36100 RepID=UPI001EE610E9|nr:NF-kappa-B inhibitor alpha-like [Haliotis rubra]